MSQVIAELADYKPHANQLLFHRSKSKLVIVISPRRSGKSFGIAHDAVVSAFNNPHSHSGVLVAGPVLNQVLESLVEPILQISKEIGVFANHSGLKKRITLINGKHIYYRSLEQPDNARGLTLFKAYVDEAAFVSQYAVDVVSPMLLTTNGQLILISTPNGTNNWLYKQYFEDENKRPKDLQVIRYRITDNPSLSPEAIESLYRRYDPLMAKQELEGEFINLSNTLVYHSFNYDLNTFTKLPEDIKFYPYIYVFLDYNVDMMPALICRRTLDNKFYITEEVYGSRDCITLGHTLKQKFGVNIFIIDDSVGGNQRNQSNGLTNRMILHQLGFTNISQTITNPKRIERYANLNAHFCNARGTSRIYINRSCVNLISELKNLTYKPGTDEPFIGAHIRNDCTDALGYGIMHLSPNAGYEPVTYEQYPFAHLLTT